MEQKRTQYTVTPTTGAVVAAIQAIAQAKEAMYKAYEELYDDNGKRYNDNYEIWKGLDATSAELLYFSVMENLSYDNDTERVQTQQL